VGINLQTIQDALNEAFTNLITSVTLFLPRLLNAVILLFIGWLLARLVSTLVSRLLTRLKFDQLLDRGGLDQILERAEVHIRPVDVLARLSYWLILLAFVLAAVDALGLQAAAGAIRELLAYIPNLIGAVLVIVGGGLLARFLGQATQTLAVGANLDFHKGLGAIVRYFILALTFILAASLLGLDVSFLGGALANIVIVIVAAAGLTFALGGRDLVKNILSGIYAKEIYNLGDAVSFQNHEGTLESIGTFKTTITTPDNIITVPNSLLINEVVISRNAEMRPD